MVIFSHNHSHLKYYTFGSVSAGQEFSLFFCHFLSLKSVRVTKPDEEVPLFQSLVVYYMLLNAHAINTLVGPVESF